MQRAKKPVAQRIWKHFDRRGENDCWPWTGAIDGSGYGRIRDDRAEIKAATRVMWEILHGPIPAGMNLLHRCDFRACVNPRHLFLGTPQDNTEDMHRKDRGRSKLTVDQVREIRRLLSDGGLRQSEIAARYGVKEPCIQRIATRRTWAWA